MCPILGPSHYSCGRPPLFAQNNSSAIPAAVKIALLLALASVTLLDGEARADKSTVCTITVNSADEKDTFRRYLPEDKYRFVELVEKGRPDWLASACRQQVSCDVLVISGHFNGTEFFSEHVDSREYLPVEEMERASCSESCPGLFSKLKEVYLFGCNTLNAEPANSASAEVARVMVRSGSSRADAERVARALNERHAESNREGMRRIFMDVPVLYGFSSTAPVGAVAAGVLDRYFRGGAAGEVGKGRPSARLLGQFSTHAMTAAAGLRASDPRAAHRQEVCQFYDERLSAAETLAFVHRILQRDIGEVRMYLERMETFAASLSDGDRAPSRYGDALQALLEDSAARQRYLAFVHASDEPAVRARMIRLARNLGWLSAQEELGEIVKMVTDVMSSAAIAADHVALICALNEERSLDALLDLNAASRAPAPSAAHAAVRACLGSKADRERMLQTLTSANDDDVRMAQLYVERHPITDVAELRTIAARIALMTEPQAQVRALNALAGHRLADRASLEELVRLFPNARTVGVQRALAGIFIRSDFRMINTRALAGMLREYRIKSADGEDLIDVLIRRLQAA